MPDLTFKPEPWVELRVFGPRAGCRQSGFLPFWTVHPIQDGLPGLPVKDHRGEIRIFLSVADAERAIDDIRTARRRFMVGGIDAGPKRVEFGGMKFKRSCDADQKVGRDFHREIHGHPAPSDSEKGDDLDQD